MTLANLLKHSDSRELRLDRISLKDQSTELLRNYIISGHIPQGTKLAERELVDLLGVSRMPARDALMDLEREGLVVSRPKGRYVIELYQMHQELADAICAGDGSQSVRSIETQMQNSVTLSYRVFSEQRDDARPSISLLS